MPKRVYPVPEIILSPGIRIEDTADGHVGSMDNDARIMRVPLMDTPNCRHVRAHEMAHAKYSPKKPLAPAGIHPMTLQRVEDMRMNVHCRNQGLNEAMDAPIITEPHIWGRLLTDERSVLTAGISTFDTGDWNDYLYHGKRQAKEYSEFIADIHQQMKENPSWDQTIKLAFQVERFLNPDPEPEPSEGDSGEEPSESEPGEGAEGTPSDESGNSKSDTNETYDGPMEEFDLSGDLLDKMVDNILKEDERKMALTPFERGVETLMMQKEVLGSDDDAIIVPVKVTVQKMPKRLPPSKFKSRQKVPADMGMVPKHMHRYCTDKAIFAGRGRKRSRGGTVIIDASGSMSIHPSQIDEILDEIPLGTIATYSGLKGDHGDLFVIAKNGARAIAKNGARAVNNLRPRGLMNLVDVPALEWMLKQDGPYYWVCDGEVSGANSRKTGERFGRNIFDRCIEIVEQNGIIMVPTLDALVKTIHGK
jgi:hypothetical protein